MSCPPCKAPGLCDHGERCPLTDDDDSLGLWVGLRNAIAITAGLAVLVLGGYELLRRVLS